LNTGVVVHAGTAGSFLPQGYFSYCCVYSRDVTVIYHVLQQCLLPVTAALVCIVLSCMCF